MAITPFYHGTIKILIAAFGTVFNDIKIETGHGDIITIPLHYSPKEKFTAYIAEKGDQSPTGIERTLPRMGFELASLQPNAQRAANPLARVQDQSKNGKYMFSRVPYDFNFNLYISTTRFEDSLKIVEQILPNFRPELNISVRDKEDFGLVTDIPISLTSVSYTIDYEGPMPYSKRIIEWELTFLMKAWLYGSEKTQDRIKKTITNMHLSDYDNQFKRFISEVVPANANKEDPHSIVDSIEESDD